MSIGSRAEAIQVAKCMHKHSISIVNEGKFAAFRHYSIDEGQSVTGSAV